MKNFNCGCNYDCTGISFVVSIIIGIIVAMLKYTSAITVTSAFLWVVFGIAVVYFALVFGISALLDISGSKCSCSSVSSVVFGALGTILTSVILLAIDFAAGSFVEVVITGGMLFFLSLLFTSVACLIRCLSDCGE